MNNSKAILIGAVFGGLLVSAFYQWSGNTQQTNKDAATEKEPLYWVAPMDPNYLRDKPGKSPMGMDLIAVYDEGVSGGPDEGPGTVTISPEVVNNLGVRTALVKRKVLQPNIATVGYVRYDEDRLVHVHPRVEGWIEKLYVKAAGDPVDKGQPLYDIYSPALVNAQEEFLMALERNNKRLIQAGRDRLKALQLPNEAIQRLIKTRKVAQFITLFAPQSGVVNYLKIREGFYVKPGTTLMSIGTLDQVWVDAEIFERQAFAVALGTPVTMTLDFLPGKRWQGKIDYIYPTLDSKTRTMKVRLRFDNPEQALKPNMFAQVVIHVTSEEATLVVPKEAVIRTGGSDRVVLALGEGRFKSIDVLVGRFDANNFEILRGVYDDESVVVSAQFLLDSESSKSSDFKRMSALEDKTQATVKGVINRVDNANRVMNISRGAIDKWGRGPTTMDFKLAEHIKAQHFSADVAVTFTFKIVEGEFVIVDIRPEV